MRGSSASPNISDIDEDGDSQKTCFRPRGSITLLSRSSHNSRKSCADLKRVHILRLCGHTYSSLLSTPHSACIRNMASLEALVPDQKVISKILHDQIDLGYALCDVLSNTSDTCTFRLEHDNEFRRLPNNCLAHLETSRQHLLTVNMLQKLAQFRLGD